jgi:hypothetical protein
MEKTEHNPLAVRKNCGHTVIRLANQIAGRLA